MPSTDRSPSTALPSAAPRPSGDAASSASRELRNLVARALRSEMRVDALIAAVACGKTFSASELRVLQATVFRHWQTAEVLSRTAFRVHPSAL